MSKVDGNIKRPYRYSISSQNTSKHSKASVKFFVTMKDKPALAHHQPIPITGLNICHMVLV